MKQLLLALAVSVCCCEAAAWPWSASSYAECILDRMPDAMNEVIARQTAVECYREFPGGFNKTDDVRGGGQEKIEACITKYARKTPDRFAANMIRSACTHIYGPR
jgi:hypothetical protein